jgi:outer membrane protein
VKAPARYINTKASFAVGGDRISAADISIDPMVYSLMLGYKF